MIDVRVWMNLPCVRTAGRDLRAPRTLRWLLASALLLLPAVAPGATSLFLDSDTGDYIGGGTVRLLSSVDGAFVASTDGHEVRISFHTPTYSEVWSLTFSSPLGEVLAPGVYENAARFSSLARPGLDVNGDGRGCTFVSGRFVVHEAPFVLDSQVAFAADFEQHCEHGPALHGAIRFGSGVTACTSGADGTPCDDYDSCTAQDVCLQGVCAGTDSVSASCGSGDACHDVPRCSPLTGACVHKTRPDYAPCNDGNPCTYIDRCQSGLCLGIPNNDRCDDGNRCTQNDRCSNGICSSGTLVNCDDHDSCTTDRCDPVRGCVADPVPACWNIDGRGVVNASATGSGNGRTVTCTLRCQLPLSGGLVLAPDDSYRQPANDAGVCPSGSQVVVPDETGTVVHRRKRLLFKPRNQAEVVRALRACTGRHVRLVRDRTAIQIAADGVHLVGTERTQIVLPARFPIHVSGVFHFNGALGTTPEPLEPPRRLLPVCTPDLSATCVTH